MYVRHQHDVYFFVSTGIDQLGLATAILFGRCSQQPGATGNVELLQEIYLLIS